jgi:pimeloyl-ACP methyl ester carboxylesterase
MKRPGRTGLRARRVFGRSSSPEPHEPGAEEGALEDIAAPGPWLVMMEARAPWELAFTLAATPWLRRLPSGDGHPVIVYPGLGASDVTTLALRNFLRDRGYSTYPWKQGLNLGPREGVLEACREQLQFVSRKHREKVSLVGWSLGGIYAREMAKELPDLARCVVTLGTPFAGHPRATNAWRFYELVSGQDTLDPALLAQVRTPPPVPTTSIYSKTDGVVAWRCSINEPGPRVENIEVHASHIGMGMNPLALYAVADRLAQDPERWKPFDAAAVQGPHRWLFSTEPPPGTRFGR